MCHLLSNTKSWSSGKSLGLGLERQGLGLGLGLEPQGLGLGLEQQGLGLDKKVLVTALTVTTVLLSDEQTVSQPIVLLGPTVLSSGRTQIVQIFGVVFHCLYIPS